MTSIPLQDHPYVLPEGMVLSSQTIVNMATEGAAGWRNPLSKFYTRQSATRLFPGIDKISCLARQTMPFIPYKFLDAPRSFFYRLKKRFLLAVERLGWGCFLYVTISGKQTTSLKDGTQNSRD